MQVTHLLLLFGALLGVLLLLVMIYIARRSKGAPRRSGRGGPVSSVPKEHPSFERAEAVILNRGSSREELIAAVELIAGRYGKVHATTLTRYTHLIVALCRHPHTDKDLVLALDRALSSQNPHLRRELELALQKGLNARV